MTTLARAAASYHGIPLDVIVRTDVHTGDDGVLYLTVQIPIKDDDLGPIVKRMGQLAEQAQDQQHTFVADDPMQLKQLREDWAALTPAQRGEHKSFARYKAYREAEAGDEIMEAICQSAEAQGHKVLARGQDEEDYSELQQAITDIAMQGVGGRKVQHVDVPEQQDADIELPAAVWLWGHQATDTQKQMASDQRGEPGHEQQYLLQVDMLTAEQKAKYCPEEQKS